MLLTFRETAKKYKERGGKQPLLSHNNIIMKIYTFLKYSLKEEIIKKKYILM